jgi:type I restriction enzyme S subunit
MKNIKNNWPTKKLGDKEFFEILGSGIERYEGEKEYISTSSIEGNKIISFEAKISYKNRPSRANMQPCLNSVWFARMQNTIKVYSFTEQNKKEVDKFIFSTGFSGILCNTEKVEPRYLEKIFLSEWFNKIKDSLAGDKAIQKSLNNKDIENLEIPLPPLPIQQKIVKILDAIQEGVKVQGKIIEKTKELKKSLMADLFKYGAPSFRKGRKLKKTEIGEIPEDWEVMRLGEEMKLVNGKRPNFVENGNIPIYGANGVMGYTNQILIDQIFTLIIGRVGASGEIHLASGKVWVSDNALYSYKVNENKLYIPFLAEYLRYKDLKKFATKGTHPIITQSFLESFQVPLPPLPEQQEIAEILQTIDQKIEIEQKKKALYEELFKTMLNKIMNQEIDVEKIDIG